MSAENKAIARRFTEEVWNQGNLAAVDELFAPEYDRHLMESGQQPGREGLKKFIATFRTAFPDIQMTIEDQLAEGDKVMTRWRGRGTHRGDFQGLAPTQRPVTFEGISVAHIVNGQIVEAWGTWNTAGVLKQLGAAPATGQTTK